MTYAFRPGLYRVGNPDEHSPVLVTANYKLTVDSVRRNLAGLNVWLLVLDTKAVNVWCAAGKGTFSTEELIRRIGITGLTTFVAHRHLILPQLSATGVAAHEVKRGTGFQVHYGPVRAADIPAYLAARMKATPAMRRVTFSFKERLVVTPVEITSKLKIALAASAALAILDIVRNGRLTAHLAADIAPFLAAWLTGGVLTPLLLPRIPFRAFVLKGAAMGALAAAASIILLPMGVLEAAGTAMLMLAISSFLAMMFTGSTTFTTLEGAKLEVRRGMPAILVAAGLGAILRIAAVFV
jgi:hypothetical protein